MKQEHNIIKKVIIIGHDNYGTREIFSSLVHANPELEFSLIITTGLYYKKSILASFVKLIREASLTFCFYRFIEILRYKFKGDTLCTRAEQQRIPIYYTKDVNGASAHNFIKRFAPDIIISTFTMHILKQPTIELSGIATIGIHPSILPDYRGLEVFFWALANGEISSGVSIFYLKEKIDGGQVIMQEKFDITPEETLESIYIKLTRVSAGLLVVALDKFKHNEKFLYIPSCGSGRYFPMPTREAYKRFKRLGRRWRGNNKNERISIQ